MVDPSLLERLYGLLIAGAMLSVALYCMSLYVSVFIGFIREIVDDLKIRKRIKSTFRIRVVEEPGTAKKIIEVKGWHKTGGPKNVAYLTSVFEILGNDKLVPISSKLPFLQRPGSTDFQYVIEVGLVPDRIGSEKWVRVGEVDPSWLELPTGLKKKYMVLVRVLEVDRFPGIAREFNLPGSIRGFICCDRALIKF